MMGVRDESRHGTLGGVIFFLLRPLDIVYYKGGKDGPNLRMFWPNQRDTGRQGPGGGGPVCGGQACLTCQP